jgi:medium-chain acyl-[acyl-carrier-protein] hydrolase
MKRIKLFCFPYAGGSAAIFSTWQRLLDPIVELRPIELTGRGRRMNELLYGSMEEMVSDVLRVIKPEIRHHSYALFGHSMGCMVAYALAQMTRELGLQRPQHIFFSGQRAPHVKRPDEIKYDLMDEKEFIEAVIGLGGTSPEFFHHPELFRLFMPMLRNDFRLAEEEKDTREINPLDTDITVFLGKEDDLTAEECAGWKEHTRTMCTLHYFNGGHFFLHDQAAGITKLINSSLRDNVRTYPNHLEFAE